MTDEPNGEGQAPAEDTVAASEAAAEALNNPAPDAGATPEPEAQPESPAKPKQTAQQRIDELTWHKRELERQNAALLDRIGKAPTEEKPAEAPQADAEPNPDDYEHGEFDRGFIKDLTRFEARQAHREIASQDKAQTTQAQAVDTFEGRVKTLFPDGEPEGLAAIRTMEKLPIALQDFMLESDVGPKIADHYGRNPAELARLSTLTVAQQAREIARQEVALSASAAPEPPVGKTATDAPEPAPTARGAGGKFQVPDDTNDFAAFEKRAAAILQG